MDRLVCSTGSESVQVASDNALLHWQDDGLLVSESASTTRDAGAAELVLRNFKLNDWEAIMIGFLQSGSSHTLCVCVCHGDASATGSNYKGFPSRCLVTGPLADWAFKSRHTVTTGKTSPSSGSSAPTLLARRSRYGARVGAETKRTGSCASGVTACASS